MERERIPIACTLSADEVPDRVDDWKSLLSTALDRESTVSGVRVRLPHDAAVVASAGRLAVDESACCGFFSFGLSITGGEVWLEVTAPEDARPILDTLFASPP